MDSNILFWLALGMAAGWGVSVGSRRLRAAKAAPPKPVPASASAAEVDAPPPLGAHLQQIGQGLETAGEHVAHGRDFLDMPDFQVAVARLAEPSTPMQALLGYALGTNWGLACAAYEALIRREDRAQALDRALAGFDRLPPGTVHFALRYFDSLEDRPPVGAPVAFAKEWWVNFTNVQASFLESFERRAALGDAVTFGDWLSHKSAAAPAVIEQFLAEIDHPYARALAALAGEAKATRIDEGFLNGFGRFWSADGDPLLIEVEGWGEALDRVEVGILSSPPRSVLISGEARAGKTAFLKLLGARLKAKGWRVFEAGAAELMAGQMYFGQLEGRARQTVAELAAGKKVAWFVGDIALMAESGTHQGQAASLLDQILPAVNAGALVLFAEASPQSVTRLFQTRPSLRTQLSVVRLEPFAPAELDTLANELARRIGEGVGPTFLPEALETALQFSRQYVGAAPGVVVDVLKRAAHQAQAQGAAAVARETVIGALSQITGLPAEILDDSARIELNEVRGFFSERVIGQEEAVDTVVARIAMLKAGLIDPKRPVGVFLFAGPTGTGKTELAKSLAEFLFGSPDRMARLDMSEFQAPEATVKILGERGRGETDSLVDRIRKQPFSVVLLDEFEKAHPNVWDLFLQVFDDGRLTDANGYAVDCRHTLIILTSNLGATSHAGSGLGFNRTKGAYEEPQVLRAVAQTFRPEFVNRLDKVVVFKPLSRELMGAILRKELVQVLERRGLRNRDWAVEWEASALDFLLDRGFSPEMGARPLKRAIDQHLLAPLAATLVEHRYPKGGQFLFVRSNGKALEVEFVDPDADAAEAAAASPAGSLAEMILQPAGTASEQASLNACLTAIEATFAGPAWTDLKAALNTAAAAPDFWSRPDRHRVFTRIALIDRVQEAARTARRLDERLETGALAAARPSRELIARLALQVRLLQAGAEDVFEDAPVEALLCVEPALDGAAGVEVHAWRDQLQRMYRLWAERRRMPFEVVEPPAGTRGGAILRVSGFGAFRTLSREAGLHVFEAGQPRAVKRTVARVIVVAGPDEDPPGARLWAALADRLASAQDETTIVRRYRDSPSPLVRDTRAGWRSGRLQAVLDGDFDLMGPESEAAA